MAAVQERADVNKTGEGSRIRWFLRISVIVLIIAATLILGWRKGHQRGFYGHRIWPSKAACEFELTDHNGKPLRLSDLRGKVVLMCFGFTHCPNICPTTLASLNNVHQLLPADDRKKVQVVFISVDPKRDTPAQLKQYVPFFNSTFLGATTSEEQVKKIARDYGAFFEYEPQLTNDTKDNYTVTHSAYVYLIDSAGQFSVLYDYEQLSDAARIAEDIEKILHQDS